MVDAELLSILVCPACKKPVRLTPGDGKPDSPAEWLECAACRRRYPVRDDIPIMLVEESQPLGAVS